MHWVYLFVAIFLEILGTVCTKLSDGFKNPLPSIGVAVFYIASLAIFTFTVKKIDVGVAYAIWSGVGTAAIALIGIIYWREPATTMRILCMVLIIAGAVGLQLTGKGE